MTADFLQLYGVDLGDAQLLRERSWTWLRSLIVGLLSARSRTLWARLGADQQRDVRKALASGADVTPWL